MSEAERIMLYTTAPKEYDGFGTKQLSADVGRDNRGQVIRAVAIDPRDYRWQTDRYASGLHGYVTPEEAKEYPTIWGIRFWAAPPAGRGEPQESQKEGSG